MAFGLRQQHDVGSKTTYVSIGLGTAGANAEHTELRPGRNQRVISGFRVLFVFFFVSFFDFFHVKHVGSLGGGRGNASEKHLSSHAQFPAMHRSLRLVKEKEAVPWVDTAVPYLVGGHQP